MYTLATILNEWTPNDMSRWLAQAYYEDDFGAVGVCPHDSLTTQIIEIYDKLTSEARRDALRQAVGMTMSNWGHSVWGHDPGALPRLNEIGILAHEARSRPGGYVAYSLLKDSALTDNQRFLTNSADILIDIVCCFVHLDDFFQAAHDLFYRQPLWQYRPTIFFKVARVRKHEGLKMLEDLLLTITRHEGFFDISSLAAHFWRLFSPADLLPLFNVLAPAAVAALTIYFIQDQRASPVELRREFGTEQTLLRGYQEPIYSTPFRAESTLFEAESRSFESPDLDDDLAADAYFLYDKGLQKRFFDFPLGRGKAIVGLKAYEERKPRVSLSDKLGMN